MHNDGGRRLNVLAAFEDQLRVTLGHRFFGGPKLVVGLDQTIVAAFADSAVAGERIRHRPAGNRKSEARIDSGQMVYLGEPAGYVIRMPGGFSVYHAGDTALFGDMKLIGELYKPDVAMLPIGDLFTMGPREAAYAIRLLGVKHVVPMHYATFPFLTGTVDALREETKNIEGLLIHTLKPGETL